MPVASAPSAPPGLVTPPPVANTCTTLPTAAGLDAELRLLSWFRIAPGPEPVPRPLRDLAAGGHAGLRRIAPGVERSQGMGRRLGRIRPAGILQGGLRRGPWRAGIWSGYHPAPGSAVLPIG